MLGKMIQKIRRDRGITKTKLSELTDVNIGHLTHIEKGERNPSHKTLMSICQNLNIPYQNLYLTYDRTLNDEITLTLSENGINYASYRGSFNYTIEDFRKIIITKKLIAIYISYRKAILIPRHFFTSKEEELEIESFIKEKYLHNKK